MWRAAALALMLVCAPAGVALVSAQEYPSRQIRIIVPIAAGGTGDIFARALGAELQKRFSQTVIVDNRPGGSNNTGARACAESQPDGYTLCLMQSTPVIYNQFMYKSMPFDPEKAFAPIARLFYVTAAVVANNDLKVKTMADLIALAKAKPGTITYSTFSLHVVLYVEKLKASTGAEMVRVPFRGGGEAVNAVLSGSTPVGFLGLSNMLGQLQAGLMTGLAVESDERSPLFPDLPTLAEAGVGARGSSPDWFGLFAPAGTPAPIIVKVSTEVAAITAEPQFRNAQFIARGLVPAVSTPEEFAAIIAKDRPSAERIIRELGLKAE
jgi:tripartite-type tricarboxylate transporter receptor subunit TctC